MYSTSKLITACRQFTDPSSAGFGPGSRGLVNLAPGSRGPVNHLRALRREHVGCTLVAQPVNKCTESCDVSNLPAVFRGTDFP